MQTSSAYDSGKMKRTGRNGFLRITAGLVVFCTVCSQMLPAFALGAEDAHCGLDHEHNQSCYVRTAPAEPSLDLTGTILHTHNKFCFDRDGNNICPLSGIEEHKHSDECYEVLIEETLPDEQPHTHSHECYTKEQGALICTTEEQMGHAHTDACYELLEQESAAAADIHLHTDSCYTKEQGELTCIIPEQEGHSHGDACFAVTDELICATEEGEDHTHSDTCYGRIMVCELQESIGHTHGDDCYEWTETLSCNLEEITLSVTTPEKVLICTEAEQAAHTHGDECYEWTEVLSCGKEELPAEGTNPAVPEKVLICTKIELKNHIHAAACYETDLMGTAHLICNQYQMEEHQHTEACLGFSEDALLCELAEGEEHQHSYRCYHSWTFLCQTTGAPEAEPETEPATEPVDEQMPDQTIDVEKQQDWEKTFAHVKLTGAWAYDLIAIAQTQLGYKESERNFIVQENGDQKGYTRYGDWYGDSYANWCAMFVSFCLTYANIADFPQHPGCDQWIAKLEEANMYAAADVYMPRPGDIVFFDCSRKSETAPIDSDHVGIVTEVIPSTREEPAKITTIEGNKYNSVCESTYYLDDLRILGYGILPDGPAAVYSCGLEAHTHDMDYYSPENNVVCQLQEHVHNELCRSKDLQYIDESVRVDIILNNAVYVPENLSLNCTLVSAGEELSDNEMVTAVADAVSKYSHSVEDIQLFRMELLADGYPYQLPTGVYADVQVSFTQPVFTAEEIADAEKFYTLVLAENEPNMDTGDQTIADSSTTKSYQAVEAFIDNYEYTTDGLTRLYFATNRICEFAVILADTMHK